MRKLLLITLVLAICPAIKAQEEKFSCRINVTVSADDITKSEALSYLNRELRSMNDVILTDSNPTFVIEIVALQTHAGQRANGYAFSVVVLRPLDPATINMIVANANPKEKDLWTGYLSDRSEIEGHFIQTGPELQELCKSVIASVDSDVIEKARKSWQSLQDYLKNRKSTSKTANN